MLVSFILCLVVFLMIGLLSATKASNSKQDYYVASNQVSPWLVGLSAVATNNSGYMFIGVIGYTYYQGVYAVLLMCGWLLGDLIASFVVHKKFQTISRDQNHSSYISVVTYWNQLTGNGLRYLLAFISLIFLLSYAGAQLIAGAKAIKTMLDWSIMEGAILGAVIVLAYCLAGGIRASIWTDAAQSVVMIIAMIIILYTAINAAGGIDQAYFKMKANDGLFAGSFGALHIAVFFVSWLIAGFSVIAQPHIMVRFMSLNQSGSFFQVRCWYYLWFIAFYLMATAVGLLSRIYFPVDSGFDAETALPLMAQTLLPPILTGLVLAGIFAATISTADSLVLSCSSFLSQELLPKIFSGKAACQLATFVCVVVALIWSLSDTQSVFALVIMSWGILAAVFVPLIFAALIRVRLTQIAAILLVLFNSVTTLVLGYGGLVSPYFEAAPTIILSVILLISIKLMKFNGFAR